MTEEFKIGDSILLKGEDGISGLNGRRIVSAVGVHRILYMADQSEYSIAKDRVYVLKPFFKEGHTYRHGSSSIYTYKVVSIRERGTEKFAWCESFCNADFIGMSSLDKSSFENMNEVV